MFHRPKRAIQRQVPKHPHKPSSHKRGARQVGIDNENLEFHLMKMKQYIGTDIRDPKRTDGHSMWWSHREKYKHILIFGSIDVLISRS